MRQRLLITLCLFSVAVIPFCGRGSQHAEQAVCPDATGRAAVFTPPPDSLITPSRMTAWMLCNRPLDSLSESFTKSLLSGNPTRLTDSARRRFMLDQDRICVLKGLAGGFREYRWILEHLGSSRNKAALDSIRFSFQPPQKDSVGSGSFQKNGGN